jgi:Predicted redox protein, regulator of disulfide bond formation
LTRLIADTVAPAPITTPGKIVALAACTAVDVVEILSKKRIGLSGLEIQASGEQDADPPWTFRKIHLKYILKGKGLTEKSVEQAMVPSSNS